MRKKHDINNLLANKEKRKNEKELTKNIKKNLTKGESKEINKDGYKEALICSDTIFLKQQIQLVGLIIYWLHLTIGG